MNCSANRQLDTTIVIERYNAQQEKQLYRQLHFFGSSKLQAFSKQGEVPKQICITCPLVLGRKKYVAKAWNWVEPPLLLGNDPTL